MEDENNNMLQETAKDKEINSPPLAVTPINPRTQKSATPRLTSNTIPRLYKT